MPTDLLHTLESAAWKLIVAPQTGGSVAGLYVRAGQAWLPLLRETSPEAIEAKNPSKFASFTLAPFSNRIRDARFSFRGTVYQLRPTSDDGSTQHGNVRGRPWTVTQADETVLECQLDSRDFTDFNYPFPLTVTIRYEVEGEALRIRLSLTNVGDEAMPAGFGLHPYVNRVLGNSTELQLSFDAAGLYETDETFIPSEGIKPVPSEQDFSRARAVGEQAFNHVYGGWDGQARLTWPGSGAAIDLSCNEVFSHLVLFTAPDGTLGIEPVTHATDGFNLLARGVAGTGVQVLETGETMTGTVTLTSQQDQQ